MVDTAASEFKTVRLEEWILPPDAVFLEVALPELESLSPLLSPELVTFASVEQIGPPVEALIEQYSKASISRRPKRTRPVIEEQGLLFTLQ